MRRNGEGGEGGIMKGRSEGKCYKKKVRGKGEGKTLRGNKSNDAERKG